MMRLDVQQAKFKEALEAACVLECELENLKSKMGEMLSSARARAQVVIMRVQEDAKSRLEKAADENAARWEQIMSLEQELVRVENDKVQTALQLEEERKEWQRFMHEKELNDAAEAEMSAAHADIFGKELEEKNAKIYLLGSIVKRLAASANAVEVNMLSCTKDFELMKDSFIEKIRLLVVQERMAAKEHLEKIEEELAKRAEEIKSLKQELERTDLARQSGVDALSKMEIEREELQELRRSLESQSALLSADLEAEKEEVLKFQVQAVTAQRSCAKMGKALDGARTNQLGYRDKMVEKLATRLTEMGTRQYLRRWKNMMMAAKIKRRKSALVLQRGMILRLWTGFERWREEVMSVVSERKWQDERDERTKLQAQLMQKETAIKELTNA
jgi:hypothetical protein